MNVLIVEDEPLAVERLIELIKSCDPYIQILSSIDTVSEAAVYMEKHEDILDLIFLDIQLADGKSFEIFNKISFSKPIIFTTAYDEYAIQAFKVNSIDYLLKPVKQEELEGALNKFNELSKNNNHSPTFDQNALTQLLTNTKNYKQRFLVKFGSKIQYKNSSEAAFFYAEDKICHLHTFNDGKKYLIDHTLEELQNQLLDPNKFFRISRQCIINIDAIREIVSQSNRLQIISKAPAENTLWVSRSRISEFKEWLDR